MLSLTEVQLLCPPPVPYKDVEAARKERTDGAKSRKPKNKNGGETMADAAAAGSAGTIASDQQKGETKKMKSKKMKGKKVREKKGEEVKDRAAAGSAAAAKEGEDVDLERGGKTLKLHQKCDDKGNGGNQEVYSIQSVLREAFSVCCVNSCARTSDDVRRKFDQR